MSSMAWALNGLFTYRSVPATHVGGLAVGSVQRWQPFARVFIAVCGTATQKAADHENADGTSHDMSIDSRRTPSGSSTENSFTATLDSW